MPYQFTKGLEPVRSGENAWGLFDDDGVIIAVVLSESTPDPVDGIWRPLYNEKRVRSSSYIPYSANTEWAREANRLMKDQAEYNYRKSYTK